LAKGLIVAAAALIGAVAGCTGLSQPRAATSSNATQTAAIGDSCLVGRWVGTNESAPGNWSWNNDVISVSGLSGLIITYSEDGKETDELAGTQPLIGDFHGHQIKIVLRGSATYSIHADGHHIVQTTVSGNPTVTYYYDGAVQPGGTASFAVSTNSYRCSASGLHIESPAGHAGYGPQVDELTRG
jgi:hypothetical protein